MMSRPIFIKVFGGVFEHSPWIADRAFSQKYNKPCDDAFSLHQVLVTMFRRASDRERLAVLKAHPDLAGKLARAGRLTPDSTAEQANAGLDLLTDGERETFSELNETYTMKHGFPFIIAVRDHDKASILRAFHQRVGHDHETEFGEACRQVERIAFLRLRDMLPDK